MSAGQREYDAVSVTKRVRSFVMRRRGCQKRAKGWRSWTKHLIQSHLLVRCLLSQTSAFPHRYRSRVAYDGSSFQGFQIQEGTSRRTVQGELERVLSQRLQEKIRVVGAGRTGK